MIDQKENLEAMIKNARTLLTLYSVEKLMKHYTRQELYTRCMYKDIQVTTHMRKALLAHMFNAYWQNKYDALVIEHMQKYPLTEED